jgi:hypothetical protein
MPVSIRSGSPKRPSGVRNTQVPQWLAIGTIAAIVLVLAYFGYSKLSTPSGDMLPSKAAADAIRTGIITPDVTTHSTSDAPTPEVTNNIKNWIKTHEGKGPPQGR